MKKIIEIVCLILSLILVLVNATSAETFQVIEDEWLWFSSNLETIDLDTFAISHNTSKEQRFKLGNLSYDKYFEQHGQPPPHNFIQLLNKKVPAARIDGKDIVFSKTGVKIPLKTNHFPSGADQALPYVMEIPESRIVMVVYPYYFYGCKDNDHIVEVYTEDGSLFHHFDSLPTHFVKENPQLLIAPERSGCCDSLRWSMRFYDLKKGKVSKYECPEGACGDQLFVKFEQDGSFLVGLELIGNLPGIGTFIQTNVYIIDDQGLPLASGKIIHALKSPSINKRNIQDISPYSISKLQSVLSTTGNGSNIWLVKFKDDDLEIPLMMSGNTKDSTPAVVFLIPKESDRKEIIKFDNEVIDSLPTIVICKSGRHVLSRKLPKMMKMIDVQSDKINRILF